MSTTGKSPQNARAATRAKKTNKKDGIATPEKVEEVPLHDDSEKLSKSNAIWDESYTQLQITQESLDSVIAKSQGFDFKQTGQSRTPLLQSVSVRHEIPEAERKPPMKKVRVLRKANEDAALLESRITSENMGPKYRRDGELITHSILGSEEDYYKMALKLKEISIEEIPRRIQMKLTESEHKTILSQHVADERRMPSDSHAGDVSRSDAKPLSCDAEDFRVDPDTAALRNWQKRMQERRNLQTYIANRMQTTPSRLAMNSGESFRKLRERIHLLDRSLPFYDYGKGFRTGSEFWHQQEVVGQNEEDVIHMSCTQTEKGYPPAMLHIRQPTIIRLERGVYWDEATGEQINYPHTLAPGSFYNQRMQQVRQLASELDPHCPAANGLAVIGRAIFDSDKNERRTTANQKSVSKLSENDDEEEMEEEEEEELRNMRDNGAVRSVSMASGEQSGGGAPANQTSSAQMSEDAHRPDSPIGRIPQKILGPSLLIAGQPARWTGDSSSYSGNVGIEARVIFQCFTDEKCLEFLDIVNDGTAVITYRWKKLEEYNPFQMTPRRQRHFYFNLEEGQLLPGQHKNLPLIFKSASSGVFTERWMLETTPKLCGGASILVILRGIAIRQDVLASTRADIQATLERRKLEHMAREFLSEIVAGLRPPPRPHTPRDKYLTDELVFASNNSGLFFNEDTIQSLKGIYAEHKTNESTTRVSSSGGGGVGGGGVGGLVTSDEAQQQPPPAIQILGDDDNHDAEHSAHTEAAQDSWDYNLIRLKHMTLNSIESKTFKVDENCKKLFKAVNKLGVKSVESELNTNEQLYRVGHRHVSEFFDAVLDKIQAMRVFHSLPELTLIVEKADKKKLQMQRNKTNLSQTSKTTTTGKASSSSPSGSKPQTSSKARKPGGAAATGKETSDLTSIGELNSDAAAHQFFGEDSMTAPEATQLSLEAAAAATADDLGGENNAAANATANQDVELLAKTKSRQLAYGLLVELVENLTVMWDEIKRSGESSGATQQHFDD